MLFKNHADLAAFIGKYHTAFADIKVDKNDLSPIVKKIDDIVGYLMHEPSALSVNVTGVADLPDYGTISTSMEIKLNSNGELVCCERRV